MGFIMFPWERYFEAQTLSTSECDLIWGLYRHKQVKIKSLGWALIQYNWRNKKGKFEPRNRHTQGEYHVEMKAGNTEDCQQTIRSWERGTE